MEVFNVTKSFREGMEFPRRINGVNVKYLNTSKKSTVKIAWENTGRFINEAIKQNKTELSK